MISRKAIRSDSNLRGRKSTSHFSNDDASQTSRASCNGGSQGDDASGIFQSRVHQSPSSMSLSDNTAAAVKSMTTNDLIGSSHTKSVSNNGVQKTEQSNVNKMPPDGGLLPGDHTSLLPETAAGFPPTLPRNRQVSPISHHLTNSKANLTFPSHHLRQTILQSHQQKMQNRQNETPKSDILDL